ncbi:hypothetical protein EDB81DRAFT_891196 [Dactylonectria macrodidyma]|uniref:Uncharacterized protein n=1 Tax=Dactylonectria macrodidyma TaxID=307937 RepID=A0A9P9DLU6_9HYPO|nr:hypothetical protein EDB81DRAFT_891196 [Dactylonectria macrodidyma]
MKAVVIALSQAAVQHMLVVAAKHAGIAVIVGIFFGSAGATMLSWMLLLVIVGVLAHKYLTLPEALAKKITPELRLRNHPQGVLYTAKDDCGRPL